MAALGVLPGYVRFNKYSTGCNMAITSLKVRTPSSFRERVLLFCVYADGSCVNIQGVGCNLMPIKLNRYIASGSPGKV